MGKSRVEFRPFKRYFPIINERDTSSSQENAFSQNRELEGILRELGRISQSCRSLGWKEARESYSEALTSLARRFPITSELEKDWLIDLDAFVGGDEHINIRIERRPGRIYKITKADQFGCGVLFDPHDIELTGFNFLAQGNDDPFIYLKRWELLNSIGDYQTRFEGFVAPERDGWMPRICVSQPVLTDPVPTQKDITDALIPYGYHEVSLGAYYSMESGILLSDSFPRNVRLQDGNPALFDSIATIPQEKARKWLINKLTSSFR